MTRTIALGALTLCLTAQGGLAFDAGRERRQGRQELDALTTVVPDQAGQQGRRELDALMAKQRDDRAAYDPAAYRVPPMPSKASDRRDIRKMDGKIPTICNGC